MVIKGKEIRPETITMWINLLSFIVGILFYFRLEHNAEKNQPVIISTPIKDSVLVINAQLKSQIQQLKITQDKLIKEIHQNTELLNTQKKNVTVIRHQLQATIQSDWDSLSTKQQNAYVNQIISILKSNAK